LAVNSTKAVKTMKTFCFFYYKITFPNISSIFNFYNIIKISAINRTHKIKKKSENRYLDNAPYLPSNKYETKPKLTNYLRK